MRTGYEDIMHLPHHVSATRPRMSMHDRAAQFAPFAALAGYDAAIRETARTTETRPELDEYEREDIGERLCRILRGGAADFCDQPVAVGLNVGGFILLNNSYFHTVADKVAGARISNGRNVPSGMEIA